MTGFNIKKNSVPSGKDIANAHFEKFIANISEIEISKNNRKIAGQLMLDASPVDLLAAILEHTMGNKFDAEAYQSLVSKESRKDRSKDRDRRKGGDRKDRKSDRSDRRSKSNGPEKKIRLEKGKLDDFSGKTLAAFIEKKADIPGRLINNLMLYGHYCTFTVPEKDAGSVVKKLNQRVTTKKRTSARILD